METITNIDTIDAEIKDNIKSLVLQMEDYRKLKKIMEDEMAAGLTKAGNATSSLKMLPTYVRSLPNGKEHGNFMALDFGGTNLRVYMIQVYGTTFHEKSKSFRIPEEIKLGSGEKLFDFLTSCISEFLEIHAVEAKNMPLGFTFSFWAQQKSLSKAYLVKWSKGFVCSGVEGADLAGLLNDSLKAKNIDVNCIAVTNDTVGCMVSSALTEKNVQIGAIFGTGTNACYMEKLENVEFWDQDFNEPKQVIINTEWGALGDDNGCIDLIRSEIDIALDSNTTNPKEHLFEKMLSGKYLGEIARLTILKLINAGLLLNGHVSEKMKEPYYLETKFLSVAEQDEETFENVKRGLNHMGYEKPSDEDCQKIKYIYSVIEERAARLAATGLVVLLNRINQEKITIAVDGSLYKYSSVFQKVMKEHINELILPNIEYKIVLAEDGSGRGAALVAAGAFEN